jgi:hypothetical protein
MPAPDTTGRHELLIGLAIATSIVVLRSIVPLAFEQIVDADQAVYGLMTKHLSEFRAFPLFFYGQNYMLGVESWIAVPFFWIGGPTVAMQRLPLVLLNIAVAVGYVWVFVRLGLRPRYALATALPVIAFAPSVSTDLAAALGAGIEPFAYALLLWLIRDRPVAFGALLCFATLHREFTFLALPALALVEIGNKTFWSASSLARRGLAFAAVWLLVDILKRNINMLGPAGGDWAAGSAYVVTFLSREQVLVASTTVVRVSAHQAEVDRHASEAVTLQRLPCDTGPKVGAWCVVGPPGQ